MPPAAPAPWPELSPDQRAAVEHRGALLVTGAAGSGRTTTALAVVTDRVLTGELAVEDVLLVAPTRRAAAWLRDAVSTRLRRTAREPVVRTAASLAFSVLRARAALLGEPAPTLISGPEQDQVLAELLGGHAAGEGARVVWPERVPPAALGLRAFRDELRDLLMRAAERGLRPRDLARLGRRADRPEWVAAAAVYEEYLDVTQLRSGTPDVGARYDPAVVVDEATEALLAWHDEVPHAPRPAWRLVVVDDYQEATAATVRLLHALQDGGAELVLLADPDLAVQGFRGASPALVDRAPLAAGSELGAFGADVHVLDVVHRHGPALRQVVQGLTAEIHGTQRRHRQAPPADADVPGTAEVHLLRSPAQEAAQIAHLLRGAHLHEHVAWGRMAVVVRSGSQVAELRRSLLGARVPVSVLGSDLPLRAEPAVRPLLTALTCVIDPTALDAESAASLLTSHLGGLDPVGLRRVRRALRAEELAGGGGRTSDPLLAEVVADPARTATLPAQLREPVRRLAEVLAAGRDAAGSGGVLDVLWAMWQRAGLAEPWRRSALAGGPAGARADRDLDAVLALFSAAERFVDRMPQAAPAAFLEHLESQDLPADTLAARAAADDAVAVVTAAGAAGQEWEVVVVAGVQDGSWPDLRLRDSLLGAQHLVELLAGRAAAGTDADARTAVLDDELRAFAVAVSRATRRLVVTAVKDADHQPSALVDLVVPGVAEGPDPRLRQVPAALDLRAVVARLRTMLEAGEPAAAGLLAHLAQQGVEGADPATWYGARPASSDAPLWPVEGPVPLSPSRLETAATCALRWALESAGGTAASSRDQSLGTLVHAVAAALPQGSQEELAALLDARWAELGLVDGWLAAAARRRADVMIRKLAAYLATAGRPVAVEGRFTARLGRVELHGSVDRLELVGTDPEGRPLVRVVDLKTGKNAVAKAEAERHPQLGAYQAAVDAGAFEEVVPGARSAGAELVYVGRETNGVDTRRQAALTQGADPQWVQTLVEGVADVVTSGAMAATCNELCRMCPVRRSCPAQPEGRVVGA